jgi:hypothetical protein
MDLKKLLGENGIKSLKFEVQHTYCEICFITNSNDLNTLYNNQQKIANDIADAIYLNATFSVWAYQKECGSSLYSQDHPDDNYSYAESMSGELELDSDSKVRVMANFAPADILKLLRAIDVPPALIFPDFSPDIVKDHPVLVIPTGGLSGIDNSEQFKNTLAEYVYRGGTLIVFTQQHGYDFSALPTPDGKPLGGYGWREDQSCQSNSVYVDTWHPVLSSTTQSLISSPVDGFFTDYPPNSAVLLRRRVNAMPAMLAYPYGEGRVVITSLYEDWGSTHWQSTAQGRAIIRDLIAWAKNIALEIPEHNLRKNPNPEVSLNLEVKNLSEKAASKVKVLWLGPGRNLIFNEKKLYLIASFKA